MIIFIVLLFIAANLIQKIAIVRQYVPPINICSYFPILQVAHKCYVASY